MANVNDSTVRNPPPSTCDIDSSINHNSNNSKNHKSNHHGRMSSSKIPTRFQQHRDDENHSSDGKN